MKELLKRVEEGSADTDAAHGIAKMMFRTGGCLVLALAVWLHSNTLVISAGAFFSALWR